MDIYRPRILNTPPVAAVPGTSRVANRILNTPPVAALPGTSRVANRNDQHCFYTD